MLLHRAGQRLMREVNPLRVNSWQDGWQHWDHAFVVDETQDALRYPFCHHVGLFGEDVLVEI